jgi:hypothetical protein
MHKILIDANPDLLNQSDQWLGAAAIHFDAENNIDIVKYLIDEKEVDVNQADKEGNTALHEAAGKGHKDVVEILLAKDGIYVNKANQYGQTALHYAAARGHKDVVGLLLENMTPDSINRADDEGWTALHFAASMGNTDIVGLLLEYMTLEGINRADEDGETALNSAVGCTDVVNLITYYKKLHNLTALEPSIDKPIEDNFMFKKQNGETETLVTVDIFKKLLLEKYPESALFEQYFNNLQILQTTENKSSNHEVKDSLEKLHKIVRKFKEDSITAMDDVDLMFVQEEMFEGLKMTFSQIKSQHSSLFSVVAILKKIQLQIPLIDSENIVYQQFTESLSKEDLIIIKDFLSNADKSILFETINKYIVSEWLIEDEVKKAIEFYVENPEYQTPGKFLIKMIEHDKDSLINELITNLILKDNVLSLKNYILPQEIRKFIEELEQKDSMDKSESSKGFEVETANGDYEDSNGVKRKRSEVEEDSKSPSKEQRVEQENPSTSLEGSIDDPNEVEMEYTEGRVESNNLFSNPGDVFESAVIGANNVAVSGDIENS